MSRKDWYRNSTWTKDVKTAFFKQLDRCRSSYNKASYLRIQASHLQQTSKKKYILAALELLDLIFEKWPESQELAAAYLQCAQCFEYLHDYKSAVSAYRNSINAECEHTGVRVEAALHFGWFVVTRGMKELYDEVLSAPKPCEAALLWPEYQFKYSSIFAIILDYKGEIVPSRRFAKTALEVMAKQESPFRYHKKIGLVKNPDKAIVKNLRKIAAV